MVNDETKITLRDITERLKELSTESIMCQCRNGGRLRRILISRNLWDIYQEDIPEEYRENKFLNLDVEIIENSKFNILRLKLDND
jgi:hypothetical protein